MTTVTIKSLNQKFEQAMKDGAYGEAMQAFIALHQTAAIRRAGDFSYRYYVKPVLEHDMMANPECAPIVKLMELYAVNQMHEVHGNSKVVYSTKEALELGRKGLSNIGHYLFMRSSDATLEHDTLVRAEALFGRPFTLHDLMAFAIFQEHKSPLPALCYLFLKRDDVYLPYNCQRSALKSIEVSVFGGKINDPAMLVGLGRVLSECRMVPESRRVTLVTDLINCVGVVERAPVLDALRGEVGEALFGKAMKVNGLLERPLFKPKALKVSSLSYTRKDFEQVMTL
jgi:hypothetical protein